ncbi:MAG: hypothetical protein KY476_20150 [Planctomycetes bacterium]|nr:hypothetical protein [Planctomycetota bacterium]
MSDPLTCPHCGAPLRIRDRTLVGRRVGCPDCGGPIEVVAAGNRSLAVRKVEEAASRAPADERVVRRRRRRSKVATVNPNGETAAAAGPLLHQSRPTLLETLRSPRGIAWSAAGVMGIGLLVLVGPFGSSGSTPIVDERSRTADSDAAGSANDAPAAPIAAVEPQAAEDDGAHDRLDALGRRLAQFQLDRGHFPLGTVAADRLAPRDRLSWIAALVAADAPAGGQPFWDQPWHDPLNDRFVRRPLPEFLNPTVETQTGPNRYPATHFVGVAGVGADAAELPIDHPRAGVFGHERTTRMEDISDGAASTMLVAGVTGRLGAWAGGGSGTVRGFTREPYVNGPDGFGTGEEHGMMVLMADGSVRRISADTSPLIVRRMAAMADGLPLDAEVPGEPGDEPSPRQAPQPVAAAESVGQPMEPVAVNRPEPPVEAPLPPEPKVDIAARLRQPLAQYELNDGVPVRRLLLEFEELLGVPIVFDEPALGESAAGLDQAVSASLSETTVGDVLAELLRRGGLRFVLEERAVRVEPLGDEMK